MPMAPGPHLIWVMVGACHHPIFLLGGGTLITIPGAIAPGITIPGIHVIRIMVTEVVTGRDITMATGMDIMQEVAVDIILLVMEEADTIPAIIMAHAHQWAAA